MFKYSISHLLFIAILLTSFEVHGQKNHEKISQETKNKLTEVYEKFEETVKTKDKNGHRSLYLYDTAPVVVIPKTPNGPEDYYSSHVNRWINFFSNPEKPYELKISEIKFEKLLDGLVLSEARFDEYDNNQYSSSGLDVFTYINTDEGWKYAVLHNTVVSTNDSTDYSIPFKFDNTIAELPAKLSKAISKKDKYAFLELFHSPLGHYMQIKSKFSGKFQHPSHTVAGTIDYLLRTPAQIDFEFSKPEIKIYDQYIAVVKMDYTATINKQQKRTGKQVWLLYATAGTGWKISSIYYSPD